MKLRRWQAGSFGLKTLDNDVIQKQPACQAVIAKSAWEVMKMNLPDTRILCVDDDTHTCDWIRIVLRNSKLNTTIRKASDGQHAIELLAKEPFDLCILDYALPDMTGVQLCGRLRQIGFHVPIMFFSAMNRPIDREKAFAAGATAYLGKPDDLANFAAAVSRLLQRRNYAGLPEVQKAA